MKIKPIYIGMILLLQFPIISLLISSLRRILGFECVFRNDSICIILVPLAIISFIGFVVGIVMIIWIGIKRLFRKNKAQIKSKIN